MSPPHQASISSWFPLLTMLTLDLDKCCFNLDQCAALDQDSAPLFPATGYFNLSIIFAVPQKYALCSSYVSPSLFVGWLFAFRLPAVLGSHVSESVPRACLCLLSPLGTRNSYKPYEVILSLLHSGEEAEHGSNMPIHLHSSIVWLASLHCIVYFLCFL
jgi:hypothetical protein